MGYVNVFGLEKGTHAFEDGFLIRTETCEKSGGTILVQGFRGLLAETPGNNKYHISFDHARRLVGAQEPIGWNEGQRTLDPCKREGLGIHIPASLDILTVYLTTNKSRFLLSGVYDLYANQIREEMENKRKLFITEELRRADLRKILAKIGVPKQNIEIIATRIMGSFAQ